MLDEKIQRFLQEAGPIFFVTPTVGRAIGLEKMLPDFHIICAQDSSAIEPMRKAGVKIFCVKRNIKNSGRLLADEDVLRYVKDNCAGKQANIITFKPSPMIEVVCKKHGFRYLGNDSKINREWEDKVRFAEITDRLGISNAGSRVVKIEAENINKLASTFDFSRSRKYVVQFPHGYSGNSTFLIKSREEIENILDDNVGRKIKIADFKEGDTYTFDVCVGAFGTLISQPIFQLTGFTEFNKNILGTSGNDYAYGKNISGPLREILRRDIEKVAQEMMKGGYRGILGFDFVVGDNEVNLIEVNPRLVGSVPVFTKLEIAADETPFLLLHILSFLDFDFTGVEINGPEHEFDFSQLIKRNNKNVPLLIEKALTSGIYKIYGDKMEFVGDEYFPKDLDDGEFFLDFASSGTIVDPDMEYANIQLPCGIMGKEGKFKDGFLKIKDLVFKAIN